MTNGNDVVHPIVNGNGYDGVHSVGITKREYFAAVAMQGFLSGGTTEGILESDVSYYAGMSVRMSDELINALNTIEA